MQITTPDWVKHAVFYQIYPDRFCKNPRTQHERGITFAPWGSPAAGRVYQATDSQIKSLTLPHRDGMALVVIKGQDDDQLQ